MGSGVAAEPVYFTWPRLPFSLKSGNRSLWLRARSFRKPQCQASWPYPTFWSQVQFSYAGHHAEMVRWRNAT